MVTARLGMTKHTATTTLGDLITQYGGNLDLIDAEAALYLEDVIASRPAAGTEGRYFWATDEGLLYYDDGASWNCLAIKAATQGSIPYVNGDVKYALLSPGTANYPLVSGGAAANPSYASISAILDALIGSTRGGVLYRGASGWALLAPNTVGYVFTDGGPGEDPGWSAPSSVGDGFTKLQVTVTHADGANTSLGTCPAHCILVYASYSCGEGWNGSSPTIDIGTSGDPDAIFAAADLGMTLGSKKTRFHPLGDDGIESATEYFADVDGDGSTTGESTITLLFASFV